MLQALPAAV